MIAAPAAWADAPSNQPPQAPLVLEPPTKKSASADDQIPVPASITAETPAVGSAETPAAGPAETKAAGQGETPAGETAGETDSVIRQPPGAATGPDAEIAKRPWLLEKILGPDKERSGKDGTDQSTADARKNAGIPLPDPPSLDAIPAPLPYRAGLQDPQRTRQGRDALADDPWKDDPWSAAQRPPLRQRTQPGPAPAKIVTPPTRSNPPATPPRQQTPAATLPESRPTPGTPLQSTPPQTTPPRPLQNDLGPSINRAAPFSRDTAAKGAAAKNADDLSNPRPSEEETRDTASPLRRLAPNELPRLRPAPRSPEARSLESRSPESRSPESRSLDPAEIDALTPGSPARGSISDYGPSMRNRRRRTEPQTRGDSNPIDSSRQAPPQTLPQSREQTPGSSRPADASEPVFAPESPQPPPRRRFDYTGRPLAPLQVTRHSLGMRGPIRSVLRYYYARPEVATQRSHWGMMHAMMVYGVDTQIQVGRNRYSAIAWVAGNNPCRGMRLLERDREGIKIKIGDNLQGHSAQFLAILALCGVPSNYPIYVDGQAFRVADIIEREKRDCRAGTELTFALIGLSHYLDSDASWVASDGETWSIQRLIREELKQPVVGAACGGTHRLMGYAHALRNRRMQGKAITGQFARAQKFTDDMVDYVWRLQNRDGSMSTAWLEERQDNGSVDRKIQTTGHMVEWLLTVLPDDQLQNPRLVRSIAFLSRAFNADREHRWSVGPKGHALRSLAMYYERLYRSGTAWQPAQMAARDGSRR
ncbi:MAG: hypothetical protein AAF958_12415 [Planctomycetota bacterium]